MLDGSDIVAEEKVKAENLHGIDLKDRELIFKTLLPQEAFVDRRISTYEQIEEESNDEESLEEGSEEKRPRASEMMNQSGYTTDREIVAR